MSDLRDLYQEIIIDHGRHPRNFGILPEANLHKEGFNPLCGDKVIIHVQEKNGVVEKIMFEGTGCAISIASTSLMSEALKGKTKQEIESIFSDFHELVTHTQANEKVKERLGKLAVMSGVAEFPVRVKCATLGWHTLKAALLRDAELVTTEDNL